MREEKKACCVGLGGWKCFRNTFQAGWPQLHINRCCRRKHMCVDVTQLLAVMLDSASSSNLNSTFGRVHGESCSQTISNHTSDEVITC